MKIEFITNSAKETFELGSFLARKFKPNTIIAFKGDLGAGKTTLIKGIAATIGGINPDDINSPTFTFLNIYEGLKAFYHFDLYRLSHSEQFMQMGFDEYFQAGGICCVEWAEKIHSLLPKKRINILIEQGVQEDERKIIVESDYEEINF